MNNPIQYLSFSHTNMLRGVAILLVLLQHIAGQWGTRLFTPCGGIGVCIFLILSGYGLNESFKKNGLDGFWMKKLSRVMIPYATFELIRILVLYQDIDIYAYILDITGIQTFYWYVSFILQSYIVFFVLTKWCLKYRLHLLMLFSLLVISCYPSIQAEQALSFPLGVLFSENIEKLRSLNRRKVIIFGAACLFMGIAFLALKQLPDIRSFDGTWGYNIIQLLIKLPIALAIMIFLFHKHLMSSKTLLFLGNISYELYLVHMQFLGIIDSKNFIGSSIIFLVLSIVLSYLFYRYNKIFYRLLIKK